MLSKVQIKGHLFIYLSIYKFFYYTLWIRGSRGLAERTVSYFLYKEIYEYVKI